MAESKMIQVGEDFDLTSLVEKIKQIYQAKGFEVSAFKTESGATIKFSKDDDGIKKFVGLAQVITANIAVNNRTMIISFSDAEWMGKIIGLGIGWFLCLVPAFFAGYGLVKQMDLPKNIGNDIQLAVSGGPVPF